MLAAAFGHAKFAKLCAPSLYFASSPKAILNQVLGLAGGNAADPRRALLLSDVADSLAALDVHDGLIARPGSGTLSAGGSADQKIAIGGADILREAVHDASGSAESQRDAVHDSNDDRFFDANEDEDSEDGLVSVAAHAQGLSGLHDAAMAVQSDGDGPPGPIADHLVGPAAAAAQFPLGSVLDTPLAAQALAGSHTPVNSEQPGQAGSLGTPLPAYSPATGDIATVVAAAVSAASVSASEASFGPAAAGPPASASSIGLSVRSSVTFPSLAELASPVTPDFATQVPFYHVAITSLAMTSIAAGMPSMSTACPTGQCSR